MPTIFFSVGEPSGDQHAGGLIEQIRRQNPRVQVRGFGGPQMQAHGCQLDLQLTDHAVVGILEVLPKLRQFFRFADQAEAIFARGEIDAVVLVDFPGFNWHIAKRAKKYGIPVFYYCPPQLWAWGSWRVKKMKRYVDHVLSVLPVETEFFQSHGVATTFVGHPFFDAVAETKLDAQLMKQLDRDHLAGQPLVAVLPGSRQHEVHGNWPVMLQSIRQLHPRFPKAKFLVAAYRDEHGLWCRDQLRQEDRQLPIDFYVGRTSEIIEASRCAMMVSGSVSLELMARQTPAAVVYRVGRLFHTFARLVLQVDSITLPNLMDRQKVFPECVSVGRSEPVVDFLTDSVASMLGDAYYYQQLRQRLQSLTDRFARPGASQRCAQQILSELGWTESQPLRRAA